MIEDGKEACRALRRDARLHDARRLLEGLRAGAARDQPRHLRGRRAACATWWSGASDRPATPDELRQMEAAVGAGDGGGRLRALDLAPSTCPTASPRPRRSSRSRRSPRRYGGSYITHQRDESRRDRPEPGRGVPDRPRGQDPGRDLPPEDLRAGELGPDAGGAGAHRAGARAEGLDVSADQYPWIASSNRSTPACRSGSREGGRDKLVERLQGPGAARASRRELARDDPSWENQYLGSGGASGVLIVSVAEPRAQEVRGQDARARSARPRARTRSTRSWTS